LKKIFSAFFEEKTFHAAGTLGAVKPALHLFNFAPLHHLFLMATDTT
jgi:hypothetical protein